MKRIEYYDTDVDNNDYTISDFTELWIESGWAQQAGALLDDFVAFPVEKIGAGTLFLTGENTYTGPTIVSEGTLVLDPFSELVDSASDFTIAAGATLAFGKGVTGAYLASIAGAGDIDLNDLIYLELDGLSEDHVFSGRMFDAENGLADFSLCGCGGGSLTLTGDGNIGGALDVAWGATLILDGGSFTAGGGLLLDGTFRVVNGGTFSTTSINGASLTVDGAGSTATAFDHTYITGPLTISNGGVLASLDGADILTCSCEETLAEALVTGNGSRWDVTGSLLLDAPVDAGILTVADGGTARATVSIVVGPDSIMNIGTGGRAGTIDTPAIVNDGKILADFTDQSTLGADISGVGFLAKEGIGTLTLTGNSTYSGVTFVNGGRLNVNGSITSDVTVINGTTLGGKGSVGTVVVFAGGTIAPGTSAGALTTEDFTLLAGARLAVEIAGATAGSGYDQVRVNGTVSIAGAALDLSILDDFEPRFGQSYTIIDNDGSDAVVGQFSGFAEGAVFMLDGRLMTISYEGGDGNDVVLSKTPPPTTITGTDKADLIDATHTVAGQPLPTSDADLIDGLGGGDTINALGGDDQVWGGDGRDTLYGGDGNDWISAGKGKDALYGEAGNDTLKGGKGGDVLRGGEGDDVLVGGPGKNKLAGGDGADTFVFRSAKASDRITDFSDGDTIAIAKSAFSGLGPKGVLKAKYFHAGDHAETGAQHILYDKKSGWLLYAKHGAQTANPQELVKVGKHLSDFDHHDILVI